jgi:RNA polymerase sigma-70 factor (ECF subfamily)
MKQGSSEEKILLAGMRRGDPAAFTRLVDTYGGKIHALVRRYASTEADAEDITQESLIEICRSIGSFRGESALSTFIYRIAVNRCLKYRERQQRLPEGSVSLDGLPFAADDTQDPMRQATRNELAQEVNSALRTLSEGHREVVILHEMHGLTYAECADVLKVPIGTVKSRLFHAFARLRERLSGYVRGEECPLLSGEKEMPPARVVEVALNGGTGGGR